jgi:hypothetical protein
VRKATPNPSPSLASDIRINQDIGSLHARIEWFFGRLKKSWLLIFAPLSAYAKKI